VIACNPSTVLAAEKLMVPPPMLESMTEEDVRVMGLVPEKLIFAFAAIAFVVVIALPSKMGPEPFCVKIPFEENVLLAVVVNVPLFAREMGPAPVVVTFCRKVNPEPTKLIPPMPLVFKSSINKLVPVPADWIKVLAVIASVVRFRTVAMVKLPRGVTLPAFAKNVISAVPEERTKFPGPSSVLKKVIG
jgi:hypothetical protein